MLDNQVMRIMAVATAMLLMADAVLAKLFGG
jgi:hypothetical protein